jgi:hypothetical protein
MIIYYDMHLLGGLGLTNTESGKYFTPSLGIGQRFYVNRRTSLRIDYRAMFYHEALLEKEIPQKIGTVQGHRNNWTHVITVGIDIMFGGF